MNTLLYLLDTNTISELSKPKPNDHVVSLIMKYSRLSALPAPVWGECLYGMKRLPDSRRKDILTDFYMNTVLESFEFIPFDSHAASIYSDLKSRLEKAGRPASEMDMQIAAVAIANNLILVTRNISDFKDIEQVSALMLENWFDNSFAD